MNISAAASASPDLLAAASPLADRLPAPRAEGAEASSLSRAGGGTPRPHGPGRGREGSHGEFERTLQGAMDGNDAPDRTKRAEVHDPSECPAERPDPVAARVAREAHADDSDADDGDDAPPDGNALPPWLAVLPPPVKTSPTDGAAATGVADATVSVTADAPTLPTASVPVADAGLPTIEASETVATSAAAAASGEALAAATATSEAAAEPTPDLPPLPNGRALPAQARADGPEANAAAWLRSARFAPPDEMPAPLPPAASDVARELARAATPRADDGATALASAAGRRGLDAPLASAPAPTAPVEAPVEPLLHRAVSAALAAAGSSDVAATPIAVTPSADGTANVAALLAAAPTSPSGPAAAQNAPSLQIPTAVGAPDWDRQLADRVQVLVDRGLTNAQLKLSPAHLGPLEIRITLQNDQANVWFGTHSHATREALEAAAPRLRDLLGAQGYANVGVSVDLQQQASRGQSSAGGSRYEPEFSFAAGATAAPGVARADTARVAPRGPDRSRVDAFA
jgi:flagellar hook-length control protein FliK